MEDLLEIARTQVRRSVASDKVTACLPDSAVSGKAGAFSLEALVSLVDRPENTSGEEKHAQILVVEACLRNPEILLDGISHPNGSATTLQRWTTSVILPGKAFAVQSGYDYVSGVTSEAPKSEINLLRSMMVAGLRLLSHLQHTAPHSFDKDTKVLSCLASFSDRRDPWISPEAFEEASSSLKSYMTGELATSKNFESAVTDLLRTTVKPMFAPSKNPSITQQGRKAINALPTKSEPTAFEVEGKPWKFRAPYAVTVFGWLLDQMDATMIEANWPLLIPPLLTLVDDGSTHYKVKGCEILTRFLAVVPSNLLERTGLGEVFQEALVPCLLYLPTLTTEEESLVLLDSVYPTLIILIRSRYPGDANRKSKLKALDKIFRIGILKGYTHAGEHVKIAELLIRHMSSLMAEMGISSVKHLKRVIPLLAAILSHPFATAYPPLLKAALTAMNANIVQDWPRIAYHRGEILDGLTVCWCRIEDENKGSTEIEDIQRRIQETVQLLTTVIRRTVDVQREYQVLVNSNTRLSDLLVMS